MPKVSSRRWRTASPRSSMWLLPPSESSKSTQGSRASRSASAWPEPTSRLWVLLSGKPTARPFSWRGWRSRPWIVLLSGAANFKTFRTANSAARSTSSRPASRASRGATQAARKGKRTSGGSGPTSETSSPPWSRLRCSSKTSSSSLFGSRLGTFETWASSCRHLCGSEPATSAHPTSDTDSSLWPIATAGDGKASGAAGYSTDSGRHSGTTLTDAMRMWATPATSMCAGFTKDDEKRKAKSSGGHRRGHQGNELGRQVNDWATPTARDCKGPMHNHRQGGDDLSRQAVTTTQAGSTGGMDLNPEFVEMLMGFPRGWTDYTRLAMRSCLRWWQLHGGGS